MVLLDIVGWCLYILVLLFALSGLAYSLGAFRLGGSITYMGLCQWGLSVLYCLFFGFSNINKFHLLWAIPAGYVLSFSRVGFIFGDILGVLSEIVFSLIGLGKTRQGYVSKDKNDLIRQLAKKRVRNDPMAHYLANGDPEGEIDKLTWFQLNGLPEASLIAIVETYTKLKSMKIAEIDIFQRIESHRSSLYPSKDLPSPLTLLNYIKYRLDLEHEPGVEIKGEFSDELIREDSREAISFFISREGWSIIYSCPSCGAKNKIRGPLKKDGRYKCRRCKTLFDDTDLMIGSEFES